MVKKHKKQTNFFTKIKETLFSFVKKHTPIDEEKAQLAKEVQRNADEVLAQLRTVKKDLKQSVDGKLFTHVEDLFNPMAARIQNVTQKMGAEKEDIQELDRWINKKVRPLVESLSSNNENKKEIEKAILKHMVETCGRQIETDLRIIREDLQQKLANLSVEEEEKQALSLLIEKALTPTIESWIKLKTPPKRLSLEHVQEWKKTVDQHRNEYYERAMELIDSIIPDIAQTEEIHESLLENIKKIEHLEDALEILLEDLRAPHPHAPTKPKLTKTSPRGTPLHPLGSVSKDLTVRLELLITEAHRLEMDLRLTSELYKRLQRVKQGIHTATKILEKQKPPR